MLVDETLANIKAALTHWRASDPRLDAHLNGAPLPDAAASDVADGVVTPPPAWFPPVIAAPQWFLDEVREAYGQTRTDYEVDELCGLKVIQSDKFGEPIVVQANGNHYTVVPEWARRTAAQLQAEDAARQARAGIVTPPTELVPAA